MKTTAPLPQSITIPGAAGGQSGVLNISAAGTFFYCETASSNFQLQFDAGRQTNINPGMQVAGDFRTLTFFNPSVSPVTVTFYVADSPISSVAVTTAQLQNSLANCTLATPGQALVTVAVAGAPVTFAAAAGTFARTIICIPQKTIAPVSKGGTANTGTVYVGVAGATVDLPSDRPGPARMGAQHRRDGCDALVDHLS